MAGNRDNTLEGQLTHVIQHHMSQPGTEAQVSVHQVQSPSGSGKRHQIIIDIKQDIDIDELSTRSLAESVMETLGARSAAVYIDNSQVHVENSDMESLTTVNVIVANDLSQTTPSPQIEETEIVDDAQPAESSGILPGNRIAVDRIVEMTNAANTSTETSTSTTLSITTVATTTASGKLVYFSAVSFIFRYLGLSILGLRISSTFVFGLNILLNFPLYLTLFYEHPTIFPTNITNSKVCTDRWLISHEKPIPIIFSM
ncbi:unnamed protein product [Euphydryas editha]|uniref:Uncharacterized protein n=1 Tax=Euphydryas editha TaxID=104508 RepID=A0AAU9T901_EUPED|nr:unnamed protein product [Euphydryas editha]